MNNTTTPAEVAALNAAAAASHEKMIAAVVAYVVAAAAAFYPEREITTTNGKRWIRVAKSEGPHGRSAVCFVDKTTGDVFASASWKGPSRTVSAFAPRKSTSAPL